jgi:hypothetical protein
MEAGLPAAPAEAIAEPIAEPQPSQDRPEQIEP